MPESTMEFDSAGADAYWAAKRANDDSYFEGAITMVRKSYQLYAAKRLMSQLMDNYKHPDQAASDPKFCALKDAIAALEAEMN